MNTKKTIIFTGLSLLLSSTFNSAYSADGDETNQPNQLNQLNDPSRKRSFHSATVSDGCGAGGGASSSASSAGKTSGDESHKRPFYSATESDGSGADGGALSSSSASSAGKTPGDWAGQPLEGLAATPSNAPIADFNIFSARDADDIEGIKNWLENTPFEKQDDELLWIKIEEGSPEQYLKFDEDNQDAYNFPTMKFGPVGYAAARNKVEITKLFLGSVGKKNLDSARSYVVWAAQTQEILSLASKASKASKKSKNLKKIINENNNGTPLIFAAQRNDMVRAKLLLQNGAKVNLADEDNLFETPLMMASSLGMVKLLVRNGADVNAEDTDGQSVLDCIAYNVEIKLEERRLMLEHLINNGAKNNMEIPVPFRDLVGFDPEVQGENGMTALMRDFRYYAPCSIDPHNRESISDLLKRGANIDVQDKNGKTALMHAVEGLQDRERDAGVLKERLALLIGRGADISLKDIDGNTILDICKSEDLKGYIRTMYDVYQSTGIGLK